MVTSRIVRAKPQLSRKRRKRGQQMHSSGLYAVLGIFLELRLR
jgi:hypothetical protein